MTTDVTAGNTFPGVDAPPVPPGGLAGGYNALVPGLDEMVESNGAVRHHWRMLVSMMDDLGRVELMRRWDQARRIIRENGITHNVYDDAEGLARPWNLDLVPLPLPADKWEHLGRGLAQRARLLNALLADLYGPARSVELGLLPPELVYSNPAFLRSAHGIRPPHDLWLNLYAADMVRAADGNFCVLIDRTQAPSGAGYALENRIVLTRVLSTPFRQCNVLRLAPFFIALRQSLTTLAPAGRENPRVVLLTPGPYNETYFEHAYLARYLGYTLVQGKDLTVRDCRVYLKTLSGLQRVDVILRRVDDDFCDPLELFGGSYLGVSGLLQAVREGTVAVANAIGTGTLQAPVFLPFLPALCRHFLGEELALNSVSTWWCGQDSARRYVLDNLSRLVIKPAFSTPGSDPIFGQDLSREALHDLAARIGASPGQYVAQENLATYTAPVLNNVNSRDALQVQSRRYVVRAYLAASEGNWTVMPGALTRVTPPDSMVVSLQKGGASKDTWILGQGPVSEVSLLAPPAQQVELSRGGGDLPSRVADDLFWLGRYVRRADSTVRLARCLFNRLSDPSGIDDERTIDILAADLLIGPGARNCRQLSMELFKSTDPSGLRSSISSVRTLASALRDRISSDAWRILQRIDREVWDFDGDVDEDRLADVLELLNKLVEGFLAFGGMVSDSMTRGQGWRFLDIGLRLEASSSAARMIQATLTGPDGDDGSLLDAILEVADSSLTYRRRYLTRLEAAAVADLLIADETNPRSIASQVSAIEEHLAGLPRESCHPHRNRDHQLAIDLCAILRLADMRQACEIIRIKPADSRRPKLRDLTLEVIDHIGAISQQLSQTYFSHVLPPARLDSGGKASAPVDQEQTA